MKNKNEFKSIEKVKEKYLPNYYKKSVIKKRGIEGTGFSKELLKEIKKKLKI